MTDETSPALLKVRLDDLYAYVEPIDKRKPILWIVFFVSLLVVVSTFVEPSNKYEIRRAVGVIGFGMLLTTPLVAGVWLAIDHLKSRKTWNEIFALQRRLDTLGWSYMSAWELSESKLRPRK